MLFCIEVSLFVIIVNIYQELNFLGSSSVSYTITGYTVEYTHITSYASIFSSYIYRLADAVTLSLKQKLHLLRVVESSEEAAKISLEEHNNWESFSTGNTYNCTC